MPTPLVHPDGNTLRHNIRIHDHMQPFRRFFLPYDLKDRPQPSPIIGSSFRQRDRYREILVRAVAVPPAIACQRPALLPSLLAISKNQLPAFCLLSLKFVDILLLLVPILLLLAGYRLLALSPPPFGFVHGPFGVCPRAQTAFRTCQPRSCPMIVDKSFLPPPLPPCGGEGGGLGGGGGMCIPGSTATAPVSKARRQQIRPDRVFADAGPANTEGTRNSAPPPKY